MGIFNKVNNYEDFTPEAVEVEGIDHTMESFAKIIVDFNKEAHVLESALYISDVLMEQEVLEGASPEVLLEGVVGDFFRKVWAMIQKLWGKIKAFFKAVYRYFETLFMSGEKFVKKYKKELEDKTATGFTYTAHKFDLKKGESFADQMSGKIDRDMDEVVKRLDAVTKVAKMAASDSDGKEYKVEDEKEEMLKVLGVDSVSELVEKIREAYMSPEKEELKDFEDVSKSDMIKTLMDKTKILNELSKDAKAIDDGFKKISKSLKDAQNKFETEDASVKEKIARHVNNYISGFKFSVTVNNTVVATKRDCVGKALKSFQSTLRSYLFYKPAKESFGGDEDYSAGSSLLESAMKHV